MNAEVKRRIMNKNENDLFQKEMKHVKPLKTDNRVRHKPRRFSMRNTKNQESEEDVSAVKHSLSDAPVEDCPEKLSFSRSGLQHSLLKKLRLGKLPVENHLDLHGMTVAEASQALLAFIAECEENGCRCAIIVHGKGYSSPDNKPVIKAYLNHWLKNISSVLAFCSAQIQHGGTGAVYVLLKRSD